MGLVGGGGSILTVPILVYLLAINPITATAYSLFVVGVSALVGAIRNIQKGLVDMRTALVFSVPALTGVYLARRYVLPAIPEELFSMGDFLVTKEVGIMAFFGVIMLATRFEFSNRADLWTSTAPSKYVPAYSFGKTGMSRNRFDVLWKFFSYHFPFLDFADERWDHKPEKSFDNINVQDLSH